jgi:hypothetical protein
MVREEQIKELSHSIWEQEGRPNGKDVEHYFRAKRLLEEQEASKIIELAEPSPKIELALPPPAIEVVSPPASNRRSRKKR